MNTQQKAGPGPAFFADEIMPGCRIFFVPPPGIHFIMYSAAASSIAAAAACPTRRKDSSGRKISIPSPVFASSARQAFTRHSPTAPSTTRPKSSTFSHPSNRRYQGRVCPSMRPKAKNASNARSSPASARSWIQRNLCAGVSPSGARPHWAAKRITPSWEKYRSPTPRSPDQGSTGAAGCRSTGKNASSLSQPVMHPPPST